MSIAPVFGNLFLNEPVPHGGSIGVSDAPGFGLELNPACELIPSSQFLAPNPDKGLSLTDDDVREKKLREIEAVKTNGIVANGTNGHA